MEFPPLFAQRMRLALGEPGYAAFCAGFSRPLCKGMRLNPLKAPGAVYTALAGGKSPSPFCADLYPVEADFRPGADPLHHAGAYYMQEPSAAAPVTVMRPAPGERILDLCAAPGGKSGQIAAAMRGEGLLWCNERENSRARVLVQNLQRLGVPNAVVSSRPAGELCRALRGCFDAVLADMPCSGEGMFRKEEAALRQWSPRLVRRCAEIGSELLDAAAEALCPGGRLIVSTCTFAPEENEGQVLRFLGRHPEFRLERIDVPFGEPGFSPGAVLPFVPGAEPAADTRFCRRITPGSGGEGQFIACLRKEGDAPAAKIPEIRQAPGDSTRKAREMLAQCLASLPKGELFSAGDAVRLLPGGMPYPAGFSLLMAGVAAGIQAKNRVEPHHALFAAFAPKRYRRVIALERAGDMAPAFLRGEEIPCPAAFSGYCAVSVDGVSCGFGKASGGRLKNRYPKSLRLPPR